MLCALLILLAAAPPEVSADSARLAAQHFGDGEAAFERGDYTAAALAFERAYGVVPQATALLNAAEAWEHAGARARAVEDCERAAETPGVSAEAQAEARRRVVRLEPRVARLDVRGPEGWSIEIDGVGARRALPARAVVEPGARAVVAYDGDGRRAEQRVIDAQAGQQSELVLGSADDPVAEVASAAAPGAAVLVGREDVSGTLGPPPTGAWVAFGIAGAATVTTVVLGALTVDAQGRYEDAPDAARADAFLDRRAGTNVALGIAVAGAVTGLVWWWWGDGPD